MKCPHCGAEHPENARFCPVTGQTLLKSQERVCPVCGVAVQADWPYCQACGAPLQKHKIPYPYLASMVAGVLSILLGAYFTWGYFHTLAETADTLRSSAWRDAGRISLKESPDLLLYSPDGAMLASVQGERISVYTTSDMRLVTRLKADATVRSLQFSPSGDLLAAGLETGHVELWRLPEGVLLRTIAWNSAAVLTVDFSSDGVLLVIGDEGGVLVVCRASDGHKIHTLKLSSAVRSAAFSENTLAACGDVHCRLWNLTKGKTIRTFFPPAGGVLGMRFTPDGLLVLSTGQGFFLWQTEGGRYIRTLYTGYPHVFRLIRTGRFLLCGCGNALEVWDLLTGERVASYPAGTRRPLGLGFTPEGNLFLAVLDGNRIIQWEQTAYRDAVATLSVSAPAAAGGGGKISAGTQVVAVRPTLRPSPRPTPTRRPTATPRPTSTPLPVNEPLEVRTNAVDGAELVLVPEGEFLMGSDPGNDPYFWGAEAPSHAVTVNTFWIYRTEVTNAMYQACVAAHACPLPDQTYAVMTKSYYDNPAYADYPVIYVTYTDALAYCRWVGGRLPTEAEWEKAARGTEGILFPWGNQPPNQYLANVCDRNCARGDERENGFDDGYPGPAPVGSFPPGSSPYGAFDMGGNVWEWTSDWFQAAYYQNSPYNNPRGPTSGSRRVIRGGGWNNPASGVRTVARASMKPAESRDTIGFRCVVDNP